MFGSLVQKLQTLSPLTSPVTSPASSPKSARRRYSAKSPAHRRSLKEEFREVQSDPEDISLVLIGSSGGIGACDSSGIGGDAKKCRSKRKVEKLRGRRMEVSAPLQGSKSLGRLDGLKQVKKRLIYYM